MTLAELISEVYLLTNRSDLVSETTSAIKAATLKAHQSDYYSKDIHETGVEFTTAGYNQSLDYINLISNFRTLSYLKRVTDENDSLGKFLPILTPEETLDSYGQSKTDICYIAGRVIEIKSSVSFSKILLGCYVLPIVTDTGYASWVAEQHPYAIIKEAARVIFKTIGFDEQSSAYERLVAEEYVLLRMSGLSDVGY